MKKASQLLDRDYRRCFLVCSMIYSDSSKPSPQTLKELNEFLNHSPVHNIWKSSQMHARFSSANQLYDQLERLEGNTLQNLKTILVNIDRSIFTKIEKEFGYEEYSYESENTSINWLEHNKTKNGILEDFRKRQSSLISTLNSQVSTCLRMRSKFGISDDGSMFYPSYMGVKYDLDSFKTSLNTMLDINKLLIMHFRNNGDLYYEDYEKIQRILIHGEF